MATTAEAVPPVADTAEAGVKSLESADPFASQREDEKIGDNEEAIEDGVGKEGLSPPAEGKARRMSKEWDASKVPPSQFQKRKGSIYATPSSRDSHAETGDRDKAYFEKLKEKGWHALGKKK
jgi:hypothetical protein